jgi:hypothetical protein
VNGKCDCGLDMLLRRQAHVFHRNWIAGTALARPAVRLALFCSD